MCYRVQCSKCKKTTWAGCGRHAESVMASVPQDQKCICHLESAKKDEQAPKAGASQAKVEL